MMTRRDFEAIAAVLASQVPATRGREYVLWFAVVEEMADMLRSANRRFDWDRFVAACRVRETHSL